MQKPLIYLGFGGGVGAAGHRAFLALSLQDWEEPSVKPAPPPSHPVPTRSTQSERTRGRWWKLLSHVATVFLVLVLCFVVAVGYGLLDNRWYHVLAVDGGSMQPTIDWGDLIVITKAPKELKPGMIVTMQVKDKIVTHRVLQVDPLVTQGDANGAPDTWKLEDVRVVGVVRFWVPKLGRMLENVHLTASASGAWFRRSEGVSGEVSAGHWEVTEEETTGTADAVLNPDTTLSTMELPAERAPDAAGGDSPPVSTVVIDSSEPAPPPDTETTTGSSEFTTTTVELPPDPLTTPTGATTPTS